METLEWNADYATGIPEIDAQHSYLFELTNRFIRGIHGDSEMPALQQILSELSQYAGRHFAYEEQCMLAAGYAHLDEHRKSHERLSDRIVQYTSEVEAGRLEPRDLAEFLRNWLKLHVLREDMRYIPALTAKGVNNGNS
jgi:hemerythrin